MVTDDGKPRTLNSLRLNRQRGHDDHLAVVVARVDSPESRRDRVRLVVRDGLRPATILGRDAADLDAGTVLGF